MLDRVIIIPCDDGNACSYTYSFFICLIRLLTEIEQHKEVCLYLWDMNVCFSQNTVISKNAFKS